MRRTVVLRRLALLAALAPLAACVHSATGFSTTAIHEALPRLRATGEAYVASARPQGAWLHMGDRLTLDGGAQLTTAELVAPCPLVPDPERHCALDDGHTVSRVVEDPVATLVLWGSLALLLASVIEPIACWTACHDQGWELGSGVAMGVGMTLGTIGLLSFMGP